MRDVNSGWLMRYLHANGASFFFIAVYLHIFRGLYYGSYKAPRELLWILGVIIYLLMMATAFMGYVLPWGQMSFWGATVITGFFSAIPLVGDRDPGTAAGRLCGRQPDAQPLLLAALPAALHDRRRGRAACLGAARDRADQPDRHRGEVEDRHRSFTPYATIKDGFAMVVFFLAFMYFVFYIPNYLGHADNYIPADPLVTPAHIVPEWYFLPFYAILRAITFDIGPISAPSSAACSPCSARSPCCSSCPGSTPRGSARRSIGPGTSCSSGSSPSMPSSSAGWVPSLRKASMWRWRRSGTFYYFAFFLIIMPILGLIETPRRLPNSITEAVLEKNGGQAAPHGAQTAAETQS
jgi:ubiquinol-cytochrome c reductase cytochrome b subunit